MAAVAPKQTAGSWLGLLGWLALCFAVAAFGSQFQPGEWYAALEKPAFTPPGWVFGPVWSVLYAMMAVSAWLVWRRGGFAAAPRALGLFLAQLLINGLWSWFFFGLQRPLLALVDIVLLLILLTLTAVAFHRHSPPAAWLLLPYWLWVAFASVLNASIVYLNS